MSARIVIRTLGELGLGITLAPERHHASSKNGSAGVGEPLGALVTERNERVTGDALREAIVFDTTHVRDGVLDVAAARRMRETPTSGKKRVRPGDLLVSRLRPYLRQIAFAHPRAMDACEGRVVACSTEFYVLTPHPPNAANNVQSASDDAAGLAYLLPWFLGEAAQAALAAAQEGGHHPRVPREMLLAMRVPKARIAKRVAASRQVNSALDALYAATDVYARLLSDW